MDQPGVKALVFTVMTPSATDLLNGSLEQLQATEGAMMHAEAF